ncbi:MAG: DUF4388 domain-containing protein [Sandaracinus sp.]|nr:DUF4388 domain-containing protein [Sandaracinus sp.]
MESHLPAASLLGRTLLRLGEAKATGTLNVRGRGRARVALHAGRVVAIEVEGAPTLGDLLKVDPRRHREALGAGGPAGPVGRWLVREGLAEPSAVAHALRRQLRARFAALFTWPEVELRFVPIAAPLPPVDEPVPPTDLVLGALRDVVKVPTTSETRLRAAEWTLSPLGRAQLPRAELYPEERAMLVALQSGARGDDVLALGGGSPRALRALHAWQLVGLVVERRLEGAREGRHQALLRARRMTRRGRPLDDERAIRRALAQVHPDRFDPRLQSTCTEVVRELLASRTKRRAG